MQKVTNVTTISVRTALTSRRMRYASTTLGRRPGGRRALANSAPARRGGLHLPFVLPVVTTATRYLLLAVADAERGEVHHGQALVEVHVRQAWVVVVERLVEDE